jgi:hypothetical protein
VTGRCERSKQLLDGLEKKTTMEIGRGSTRSHCAQNSLWNRLRTNHTTDNRRRSLSSSCASILALFANYPVRIFGPNIFSSVPSHFSFNIRQISHLAVMCTRVHFNISQISLNSVLCIGSVMCLCRILTYLNVKPRFYLVYYY